MPWLMRPRSAALLATAALAACAPPRTSAPRPADDAGAAAIRVMLASTQSSAEAVSNGAWFMLDPQRRLMARVGPGDRWTIERSGDRLRGTRGAVKTGWVDGPIYASPTSDGLFTFGGRRYRGELIFRA